MTYIKKIVKQARNNALSFASHGQVEQVLTWRLADAIEALVAERDALRAQLAALRSGTEGGTS